MNTSVAQRLVRLLCPHCKREEKLDAHLFPPAYRLPEPLHSHHVAVGCEQCYDTGYKGRKAIYEIIPVDHDISELIRKNESEIGDHLKSRGIRSLADNAFELLKSGQTSLDEVYPLLMNL
jgi:general secretion pathway protein E/type IV pilus assembly protein PilB